MVDKHQRGLMLAIRSDPYERKCGLCSGTGKHGLEKCWHCHGSGKHTIMLVGYVAVFRIGRDTLATKGKPRLHSSLEGELMGKITTAYQAGTLPAELLYDKKTNPDGLRVIEVTE